MENNVIKFVWEYNNIIHSKVNLGGKDKLELLYILSYLKLAKPNIFTKAINQQNFKTKNFVSLIKNENYDEEFLLLSNREKINKNENFVISELEKISYSLENLDGILQLINNRDNKVILDFFKVNTETIYRGGRELECTPLNVNIVVNNILNINQNDRIMDVGSGLGDYLISVYNNDNQIELNGIEINQYAYNMSQLRFTALHKDVNLLNTDVFETLIESKYDKIFCNYPWGFRMDKIRLDRILSQFNNMKFKWEKFPGASMDWLFINSMLSMLKSNGRAIAIMPDGPLYKTADNKYKEDLINSGYIEAVIKLPEKIFHSTCLSCNIVVFSHENKNVKFIDASKAVLGNPKDPKLDIDMVKKLLTKQKDDCIGFADKNKIASNDYVLTVDYYLPKSEINYHNPEKLSKYIIDIFRGLQITPAEIEELEDENGDYEIVRISDIEDGIISNNLKKLKILNNKYDRYLIKDKDIIISSKGTRIKIAVANISNRKIIANGNLIVLRVDTEKINPYYLSMYLMSKEGTIILNRIQTGRAIISINPSKLSEITISTIPMERQEELSKKYECIQQQLIFAKKHLEDLTRKKEELFDNEIARMVEKNE